MAATGRIRRSPAHPADRNYAARVRHPQHPAQARWRAEGAARLRHLVDRLLCVLVLLVAAPLASCSVDRADLDRVGPPLRFSDLRETARWTPGFDPEWWEPIDRAYARYDDEVAGVARGAWEALLTELSDADQTGFPTERVAARAVWERHLRVRRELDQAESRLLDAIDAELPDDARAFIALMRARAAFWRAGAVWAPHGERLPGPLELITLTGEPVATDALARAATDSYARLAAVAAQAADERFRAYLAYCDDLGPAEARFREAQAARAAIPEGAPPAEIAIADTRVGEAYGAMSALSARLNTRDRRVALEKLRVALLRENRAVAEAIDSPERRADVLERIDAFLHLGVRSLPSIRAVRDLARRIAERQHPDEPERLARIDVAFETYVKAAAPLRTRLASASSSDRAQAHQALIALVEPLMREFSGASGVPAVALDRSAVEVSTGRASVDEAADGVLAPSEPEPEPPEEVDEALRDSRRTFEIICGMALSPRPFAILADELDLSPEAAEELAAFRRTEAERLVERTGGIVDRLEERSREIVEDGTQEPSARARRFLREARATAAEVRAFDRAANERVLGEAARVAGVALDDARLARARLSLEQQSLVGMARSSRGMSVCGLTAAAVVDPLEIVRRMDADDMTREAALALAFGHADSLLEAQREIAVGIMRNLEDFTRILIEREGRGDRPEKPWHAQESGARALAVRDAIAAEIGVALGEDAASAFLSSWRALADPSMDPPRHPAIAPLAALAAGARLDPAAARASADSRAVLSEFLAQADESRDRVLRELGAWRARHVRASDLDSSDGWRAVAAHSAIGASLRARAIDADERALARCEALLADAPGLADGLALLRRVPAPLPTRIAPYFPEVE